MLHKILFSDRNRDIFGLWHVLSCKIPGGFFSRPQILHSRRLANTSMIVAFLEQSQVPSITYILYTVHTTLENDFFNFFPANFFLDPQTLLLWCHRMSPMVSRSWNTPMSQASVPAQCVFISLKRPMHLFFCNGGSIHTLQPFTAVETPSLCDGQVALYSWKASMSSSKLSEWFLNWLDFANWEKYFFDPITKSNK